MQADFIDFKLPFAKIPGSRKQKNLNEDEEINLGSGYLTAKQISLVFNHLPVDITYVDENNKVRYFSTPKKRFFMRTNAIIGRDVKNCHPQESVHVVEKIVEAFRKGEKDRATFWINIKGIYLFIQYFAVRDEQNTFRGVVEVTQEINEIQEIKGERKLLSWDE
jgi:PAS domain S-box-containing protein